MSNSSLKSSLKRNDIFVCMQHHRFNLLLGSLVVLYLSMPVIQMSFTDPDHTAGRVVIACLFAALLLAVILAISKRPIVTRIALCLALPYLALDVAVVFTDSTVVWILQHVANIIFLGFVSLAILGYVFSAEKIRANTISASLCVYFMLGLLWAIIFSLLTFVDAGAFSFAFESDTEKPLMRFGSGDSIYPVYFSIVTLTTLGYGDITPANSISRTMASFEAIMGQIYLAVLVARLVGLHTSQSFRRRYGQEEDEQPPPDRKS